MGICLEEGVGNKGMGLDRVLKTNTHTHILYTYIYIYIYISKFKYICIYIYTICLFAADPLTNLSCHLLRVKLFASGVPISHQPRHAARLQRLDWQVVEKMHAPKVPVVEELCPCQV